MRITIGLSLLALVSVAEAHKAGIAGESGQAGHDCNRCHSGGEAPMVMLIGPSLLATGTSAKYQLVIEGGAATVGGVGISVDDAGATLSPVSEHVRNVGATELVHNVPVRFADGTLSFEFELTAPTSETTLTLYAAGNSCDGDGRRTGDRAASTTLQVAVQANAPVVPPTTSQSMAPPPEAVGCSVATTAGNTTPTSLGLLLIALLAVGLRRSLRSSRST